MGGMEHKRKCECVLCVLGLFHRFISWDFTLKIFFPVGHGPKKFENHFLPLSNVTETLRVASLCGASFPNLELCKTSLQQYSVRTGPTGM